MYYTLLNNKFVPCGTEPQGSPYVSLSSVSAPLAPELEKYLSFPDFQIVLKNPALRFESRENLDMLCLQMLDIRDSLLKKERVYIFLTPEALFFYADTSFPLEEELLALDALSYPAALGELFFSLFSFLTHGHLDFLFGLESGIAQLEDEILSSKLQKNYTKKIIAIRKRLLAIKHYYELLLDILSSLEDNENALLSLSARKKIRMAREKVSRLLNKTSNLRDYATEVREAYQAEVDLNMNQITKILTIVTTIFMPLTLIAGWYGMNFAMPEYSHPFGYPIVIGVSLLVLILSFLFFKRRKWF